MPAAGITTVRPQGHDSSDVSASKRPMKGTQPKTHPHSSGGHRAQGAKAPTRLLATCAVLALHGCPPVVPRQGTRPIACLATPVIGATSLLFHARVLRSKFMAALAVRSTRVRCCCSKPTKVIYSRSHDLDVGSAHTRPDAAKMICLHAVRNLLAICQLDRVAVGDGAMASGRHEYPVTVLVLAAYPKKAVAEIRCVFRYWPFADMCPEPLLGRWPLIDSCWH